MSDFLLSRSPLAPEDKKTIAEINALIGNLKNLEKLRKNIKENVEFTIFPGEDPENRIGFHDKDPYDKAARQRLVAFLDNELTILKTELKTDLIA